jgi:hypothetical protein
MDLSGMENFCDLKNHTKENPQPNDHWTGLSLSDEWFNQTTPSYDIFEEMENETSTGYDTCGAFETASTTSTAPTSPAISDLRIVDQMTDKELTNLPVRELNKQLRNLPKNDALKLRRRRRSLKNRGYALNCRNKRLSENDELQNENQRLQQEVKELAEELLKTTEERDMFKKKYDRINSVFSTLCTTSALNLGKGAPVAQGS